MCDPRALAFVVAASALLATSACREAAPTDRVRVSGHVEATEVLVAPEVGGRLVELVVEEGDRVTAGQVIARLDTRDYGNTDNRGGALAVHTWQAIDYADGLVRVGRIVAEEA